MNGLTPRNRGPKDYIFGDKSLSSLSDTHFRRAITGRDRFWTSIPELQKQQETRQGPGKGYGFFCLGSTGKTRSSNNVSTEADTSWSSNVTRCMIFNEPTVPESCVTLSALGTFQDPATFPASKVHRSPPLDETFWTRTPATSCSTSRSVSTIRRCRSESPSFFTGHWHSRAYSI